MKRFLTALFALLVPLLGMAEDAAERRDLSPDDIMMTTAITIIALCIIIMAVIAIMLLKLRMHLKEMLPKSEEDLMYERQDFWSKIFQLRPMEMERKLLMDHSYDGIHELDNPTPPWFMFLFYSTIAFALIYGVVYHGMGNGKIMENEYAAQVKEAEAQREAYLKKFASSINENNVKLVTEAAGIADGKKVYDANCVACHGSRGEGKVGPNLTDAYWLHGSGIKKVFRTITEGVPEKGMIAWKKQLNPLQIQQVSSYIISLKGSNPPNPKAPQGVPENVSAPADSSAAQPDSAARASL